MTLTFSLPRNRAATKPPEARGVARDGVRLLVARLDGLQHRRFRSLSQVLEPGDLLVVNTSATLPAAVPARWRGDDVIAHFSTRLDSQTWVLELRLPDGTGPVLDAAVGDIVDFPANGAGRLEAPVAPGSGDRGVRLWRTRLLLPDSVDIFLAHHGRPISYDYLDGEWPLEAYQTVFARFDDPTGASAEMPSAARPFTPELVTDLVSHGVLVAPVVLHTGVSSLEHDEPPQPERYQVPAATVAAIDSAKRRGGRVVAVGTTVTRALETVAEPDGSVAPGSGWTELVLGPERPARVVDGLITGWHPPQASHLLLLEAVAGRSLVSEAYHTALNAGYLWHEFGDSALFLP